MAGLWIKARADLRTEPMFLALHRALMIDGAPSPLLRRCIPSLAERGSPEESVRDASRLVRDDVFALVTYSTLLDVWASVNAHCSVDGDDALMTPMVIPDIDRIAGIEGFGLAMALVGWAWQDGDNSVRFPDFRKWNEPACLRLESAESGKERARRYRDKKRAERDASRAANVTGDVTGVTGDVMRNGITEQNRTDTNTPLPPFPTGVITDPIEAAAVAIERPYLSSDRNDLHEPALAVIEEYARLVGTEHGRQSGALGAVVTLLAYRVAPALLVEAARRYGEHCRRHDTAPRVREGPAKFYREDGWRTWLRAKAEESAPARPTVAPPTLTEEQKAELIQRRKDREAKNAGR